MRIGAAPRFAFLIQSLSYEAHNRQNVVMFMILISFALHAELYGARSTRTHTWTFDAQARRPTSDREVTQLTKREFPKEGEIDDAYGLLIKQ